MRQRLRNALVYFTYNYYIMGFMKSNCYVRCLLALLMLCLGNVLSAQQPKSPPNILFIMADDLSAIDIEPYGSRQVRTPNLMRLAQEGICLDNMYNIVPMCSPTRQTLLTGLGPVRNGAYPNHSQIYDGIKTLPVYMKELGYRVALIGKKHFNPLSAYPFDFLGGRDHDNGKGIDVDLSKAEAYIQQSGEQPFFLMFTSNQPHGPWTRGDVSLYDESKIEVPPHMVDTEATRKQMVSYFAEITYLDSLVGYCLDMIERNGKKDNTIVIFTSEQGNSFPFAKWTLYDQGLRSAFIVRWPGVVPAGSRNDALMQYTDVLPTLIDMAGGNPATVHTGSTDALGNTGFDGQSFKEVLTGSRKTFRDYVYGVQTTRGIIDGSDAYACRSIRSNQYLYIWNLHHQGRFLNVVTKSALFKSWVKKDSVRAMQYVERPEEELYDLEKDPWQLHNLAKSAKYKTVKKELRANLEAFMQQQGDKGGETEMQALTRQPH